MTADDFTVLSDRLTRSLIHRDFELYQTTMGLPLRITPRGEAAYTLHTLNELRADFEIFATAIAAAQVTDIFREMHDICDLPPPDTGVKVTCLVHFFCHAHRFAGPFTGEFFVRPGPQGHRITQVISNPDHIDWTLGKRPSGPGNGLI